MPEHRPDPGAPAGPLPRAAEILDPLPPVPPLEVQEEMRDDPPERPLEGPHLLDLGRDEHLEVGREIDDSLGVLIAYSVGLVGLYVLR